MAANNALSLYHPVRKGGDSQDEEVQIINWPQRRALAFVAACGRSGYRPNTEEVSEWLKSPHPAPATYSPSRLEQGLIHFAENFGRMTQALEVFKPGDLIQPAETTVENLLRLRWLEDQSGLRLTRLGEALLADAKRSFREEPRAVVILSAHDQLAYPRLIGQIAAAGEAFLVDPYFRLDQLQTIMESTTVSRVLISKRYKGSIATRAELQTALRNTIIASRPIEIRATDDPALHDRVLVAENGEVFSLGASLNSIGVSTTVYIAVPNSGAAPIRAAVEDLWDTADVVGAAATAQLMEGSNT